MLRIVTNDDNSNPVEEVKKCIKQRSVATEITRMYSYILEDDFRNVNFATSYVTHRNRNTLLQPSERTALDNR